MPRLRTARSRRLAWTLLCSLVVFLAACDRAHESAHETQLLALGTLVEISTWGIEDERAEQAAALVERRLQAIDHDLHAWHAGPLDDVNTALAAGRAVTVSPELARLVRDGQAYETRSRGLFNPAIGNLIRLWGFASDAPPHGPPPAPSTITALLAKRPSMGDLSFEEGRLQSRNPSVRLDLGAYAKGYAIDVAIAILRHEGITNAIVNAGGDLRVIGRHGQRPWRIGIRHPFAKGVIASLQLEGDQSVVTSGNYERFYEYEGQRYHHIIDPRSGLPARGLVSVTVLAGRAELADAAATALFVAGPSGWQDVARRMSVDEVMVIDEQGQVTLTAAIAQRIHFETGLASPPEVVTP